MDLFDEPQKKNKAPENLSDKEMLMIKEKEGKKILSKIKDNSYLIALAIDGKNLSSEELAETIKTQQYELNQLRNENLLLKSKLVKAASQGFKI